MRRVEICLVHLAWAGAGPSTLQRFLDSYHAHPAGTSHRLVIAWNGYRHRDQLGAAQRIAEGTEHDDFVVQESKLDLAVYREVAQWASEPAVCFVNSYSRVLADGWLASMARHVSSSLSVGLAGATGSWESPLSTANLPRRMLRTGRYPAFPNPHIRTNAFMLERRRLLDLRWPEHHAQEPRLRAGERQRRASPARSRRGGSERSSSAATAARTTGTVGARAGLFAPVSRTTSWWRTTGRDTTTRRRGAARRKLARHGVGEQLGMPRVSRP